jgi:hypothetical protein
MAYTKSADGVASKGKTKVTVMANSGPTAANPKGGKKASGVTGEAMKSMGRNMARVANQKRG